MSSVIVLQTPWLTLAAAEPTARRLNLRQSPKMCIVGVAPPTAQSTSDDFCFQVAHAGTVYQGNRALGRAPYLKSYDPDQDTMADRRNVFAPGDTIHVTVDCDAGTLRIRTSRVDHTVPGLPAGRSWIVIVALQDASMEFAGYG